MSMELMVLAMKAKVGNPLRKLVLLKLADNANDQGECWPSYQNVAEQCELSRRSVIRHIKDLEGMGLLTIELREGNRGHSSNIFHIMPTALLAKTCQTKNTSKRGRSSQRGVSECHQGSDRESLGVVTESHPDPVIKDPVIESKDLSQSKSIERSSSASSHRVVKPKLKKPKAFKKFFTAYPAHRRGGTDPTCWKAWNQENLTDQDAEQALNWLTQAAARSPDWQPDSNHEFIPGITKFIRERRWLMPLPQAPRPRPDNTSPQVDDDIEWMNDLGI